MQSGRVSAAAAADMLGVSGPTFAKLMAERAFERQPPKAGYVLRDVVRGTVAHYQRRASGRSGPDDGMLLAKSRARWATAKAEAEERKNLAASGRLVDLELVGKVWDREFLNLRERFLSMPGVQADKLTPYTPKDRAAIHDILRDVVYEALNDVADGRTLAREAANGKTPWAEPIADDKEAVE
jgi:hypothetical protein